MWTNCRGRPPPPPPEMWGKKTTPNRSSRCEDILCFCCNRCGTAAGATRAPDGGTSATTPPASSTTRASRTVSSTRRTAKRCHPRTPLRVPVVRLLPDPVPAVLLRLRLRSKQMTTSFRRTKPRLQRARASWRKSLRTRIKKTGQEDAKSGSEGGERGGESGSTSGSGGGKKAAQTKAKAAKEAAQAEAKAAKEAKAKADRPLAVRPMGKTMRK